MLIEIRSSVLREGSIQFHSGLNVVLGDENATNSIGKSMALMLVDFAFGGDSFLEFNLDAIRALGHHSYEFTFQFDSELFHFRRDTINEKIVFRCDAAYAPVDELSTKEFTAWLKTMYLPGVKSVSFRGVVGLYSRIWPKSNIKNVQYPLHAVAAESGADCVLALIKLFDRYGEIEEAQTALTEKAAQRKALYGAIRHSIVEPITKTTYSSNVVELQSITDEVDAIRADLAKFALNIREVVDKDLLELKKTKDALLTHRLDLQSRLQRTERNLKGSKYIQSKQFEALQDFFPSVNSERIAEIELFHSSIAGVLKKELQENQKNLSVQLQEIDEKIQGLDVEIAARLKNFENPVALVDRVATLSERWSRLRSQNSLFEKKTEMDSGLKTLQAVLSGVKARVVADIEKYVNEEIAAIVVRVYGEGVRAPTLILKEDGYKFKIVDDTGTGTAYANLIIFDLAILSLTQLPILIHDSPLFKNVENSAVAQFLWEYLRSDKQVFIALDQIEKYGAEVAAELRRLCVCKLDESNVLFRRRWGKGETGSS
ncbi:DUF2326 domain-containing protein [Achromobacter dolens]|uniref:DUF2326 domain-containing protein n=1 Tax=Achromobacter dolens TaxID=1287738 RepID=UPI001583DC08|nr:DUF2326 domain-containing protein [Achromobacter dolens]